MRQQYRLFDDANLRTLTPIRERPVSFTALSLQVKKAPIGPQVYIWILTIQRHTTAVTAW